MALGPGLGTDPATVACVEEVVSGLDRALVLHPGSTNARTWLLVCQARRATARDDQQEAVAKYQQVLAIDPKNREALDATKSGYNPRKERSGLFGR